MFDLRKIELLWSKDGSWSRNSDPSNKGFSTYLIMLHSIQANKCTSSAEASFAVDCNSTSIRFSKVLFARCDELLNNIIRWSRSIHEDHVFMLDSFRSKSVCIIFMLVQPHYFSHIQVLKYVNIA